MTEAMVGMRVFIGVDPHKLSATIEVVMIGRACWRGRLGTHKASYTGMRKQVTACP